MSHGLDEMVVGFWKMTLEREIGSCMGGLWLEACGRGQLLLRLGKAALLLKTVVPLPLVQYPESSFRSCKTSEICTSIMINRASCLSPFLPEYYQHSQPAQTPCHDPI
jgi:hypothetical protein